jgi:hypothetical protein
MPVIGLSSTGREDSIEADPCVSNKLRFPIIIEHRDLETVVVGRVMYGETQLLVPEVHVSTRVDAVKHTTHHLGVCPPRLSVFVFLASLPRRAAT